jgi:hypothetical protein
VVALTDQLVGLATMSQAQLRAEWRRQHKGQVMPTGLGRDLASRAIAWRLQERVHGTLPPSSLRELKRLAQQLRNIGDLDIAREVRLKAGTKLVRQWHDRIYHVLVVEDGFQFEDRQYQSLTPIAHEITGAAWSGPRFFGLNKSNAAQD